METPAVDEGRPEGGRGFAHRGVSYDTGTPFSTFQGVLSRNVWNTQLMKEEVGLVSDELNANSIDVYGSDLGRLSETATEAAERGLHIWLDPRIPDYSQDEIIDHLAEVARLAQSLRKQGADVDLTVGATHTILTPGIFPGDHTHERIAGIFFAGDRRFGVRTGNVAERGLSPETVATLTESAPRLNDFLGRAVKVARSIFDGGLMYVATPWEQVDWTPLDHIGLKYYLMPTYLEPEQHLSELARYTAWNKPVLISGFGTATYDGAEEKGFFSWDVVDRGGEVHTVLDGYVRDEAAQARYFTKMLGIFEQAGIYGVAPSDLVHPTHPYSDDPRLDLDLASMCIVKCIRDNYADPDSPYRREVKESFRAVADYYARTGAREVVPG